MRTGLREPVSVQRLDLGEGVTLEVTLRGNWMSLKKPERDWLLRFSEVLDERRKSE